MKRSAMWLAMAMICFQIVTVLDGNGNMRMLNVIKSPGGDSAMVMDVESGRSAFVSGLKFNTITVTPLDSGEAPTIITTPMDSPFSDSFNGAFKSDW